MNSVKKEYYTKFLPFVENYVSTCHFLSQKALFNKEKIAAFLGLPYVTLRRYFNRAESEGLIKKVGRTRTFEDEKILSNWFIDEYIIIDTTKLLSMIRQVRDYCPTPEQRIAYFIKFCEASRNVTQAELDEQAAKNELYRQDTFNLYCCQELHRINEDRPYYFKGNFLLEGVNRESSPFCYTKNPEKHPESVERYRRLHDYGILNIGEEDQKASIYSTDYALNHKEILPHDIDVYGEVLGKVIDKPITTEVRSAGKVLFMPIYMSDGATNKYTAFLASEKAHPIKPEEINKQKALHVICDYAGIKSTKLIDGIDTELRNFIGTEHFLGGEIFIPESETHILMQAELHDQGILAANVFDNCYFDKDKISNSEIRDLHDKCLTQVISKWRKTA